MNVPGAIVDRMRANLAAAGIPLREDDLDAILAGPFLESVVAFEERCGEAGAGVLPDYLGDLRPIVPDSGRAGESPSAAGGGPGADSLESVARRIRDREISPVELVTEALERIAARDAELNAFQLVLAERALQRARSAEEEIARDDYRGPLHGIPIAVKDLLDMAGHPTTAGSRLLAGTRAGSDSTAVQLLERAGAVIVGKTRMSEFAYLPGSANGHYGPTRNPRDPTRDAGGSSSGSAAAVGAGVVFAAIGTDTGGSIRIPAALCGLVGLKPTYGRTSLAGAVPLAWSLDHLGPLTRTVGDAEILLGVLDAPDPRDARTMRQRPRPAPLAGARGMRVGVVSGGSAVASDAAWSAAHAAVAALERAGAELIPMEMPDLERLWVANNAILAVEAAAFHQHWLQARMEEYGEILRHRLLAAYAHGPGAFVRAQRLRSAGREAMELLFERIDLLALPTQPAGAPPLGSWGPTLLTGPFNALGWPALALPVGETAEGLPLSLQLVGRPWADELVLRAGRIVEAERRTP